MPLCCSPRDAVIADSSWQKWFVFYQHVFRVLMFYIVLQCFTLFYHLSSATKIDKWQNELPSDEISRLWSHSKTVWRQLCRYREARRPKQNTRHLWPKQITPEVVWIRLQKQCIKGRQRRGKWETSGRQVGDKWETSGRQVANAETWWNRIPVYAELRKEEGRRGRHRETRGRQAGDKRETSGRQGRYTEIRFFAGN